VHTHRGVIANAQNTRFNAAVAARMTGQPSPPPTSLITVPFFHVSGCHAGIVAAMDRGSTAVLPVGRFDPEEVLRLIEDERVTQWNAVPTMVQRVVDHRPSRPYDVSSLAAIGYGGSPSGAELQRRARITFPALRGLHIGYGLTETCGAVTINTGADLDRAPQAAGRALPIVELCIGAPPHPPGESGEVQIRSSQTMAGYWPLGSESPISTDGWLSTGDIGHLDEDVLHLTDRAKDIIIRGGENVYCAEIENRLADHQAIAEAAVIGVPHPSLGEEVGAVVLPRPGMHITGDEIREWVGSALAHFKVPSTVWFTDSPLPRNPAGKLVKAELRRTLLTEAADSAGQRTGQL
jgi:long-chain acyl-CoA synthetase